MSQGISCTFYVRYGYKVIRLGPERLPFTLIIIAVFPPCFPRLSYASTATPTFYFTHKTGLLSRSSIIFRHPLALPSFLLGCLLCHLNFRFANDPPCDLHALLQYNYALSLPQYHSLQYEHSRSVGNHKWHCEFTTFTLPDGVTGVGSRESVCRNTFLPSSENLRMSTFLRPGLPVVPGYYQLGQPSG